ncbi:MAG: hypothetical protein EOP84_29580 [Verrucomicrobiaceae bacterium]|nr:MAG: hypothetical protein EOP84_29580 [Verrucomicrobiaceae bacterium]
MLAASSSLSKQDYLILISPWTHFRSSAEIFADTRSIITAGGQIASTDEAIRETYRRNARAFYGIDEDASNDVGRLWMEDARERIDLTGTNTLVFFGEFETRVDLATAQAFLERAVPAREVHVLSKNYHETVRADRRVRDAIQKKLAGSRTGQ